MSDVTPTAEQRVADVLLAGKRRGESVLTVSVHWPIDEIRVGDVFRVIRLASDPTETAITLRRIEDVSA